MKKLIAYFLILICLKTLAQSDVGYLFGVKIAPSWNGLVTYYEVFYDGRKITETTPLPKNMFIRRIVGLEYSPANPNGENLFQKYGIQNYHIIDSLWKLRFAKYPYATNSSDTLGWTYNFANPFVPTHKQKQILASFGMDTTFYTIFGNNFFRLLKAMEDPKWVQYYKNAH